MDRNAPNDDMRVAIMREQYRMLANQVPVLYIIVLLSTFSVCWLIYAHVSHKLVFLAPAAVASVCVWRFFYWCHAQRHIDTVSAAIMSRDMRATSLLGPLFATSLSLAALSCMAWLDPYSQAFVIGIVWVATISSAFSLVALPFAAYGVLAGSGMPMAAAFLASGQALLVIVAVVNSALGVLLILTLRTNFGAFSAIIDSRARVMEERLIAEAARKEAARLADSDFLTDLANRRSFIRELTARCTSSAAFMLVLIDLDAFKPVNDIHGHAVGDEVLREVGKRLAAATHGGGLAARFGGDEFGVIIDAASDDPAAEGAINDLINRLNATYHLSVGALPVGASCGVAFSGDAPESAQALLECADIALYRSKSRGNRSAAFYRPEMRNAQRQNAA